MRLAKTATLTVPAERAMVFACEWSMLMKKSGLKIQSIMPQQCF